MALLLRSDRAADRRLAYAAEYGVTIPGLLLLDQHLQSDVTSARSIVRLTANYLGPCMRVRRVADGVEGDVGFDPAGRLSGDSLVGLDNGAVLTLTAFHAGGSLTVVEHYDQSGRPPNQVRMPAARQPTIVRNGAFIAYDGSPPLIVFDGVDDEAVWRFTRCQPHCLIVAGATPAAQGIAIMVDALESGTSNGSAAALVVRANGVTPPGRLIYAGANLGDGVSDAARYKAYVAIFDGARSELHSDGQLVARGQAGYKPCADLRVGVTAGGGHQDSSYHTLITVAGRFLDPAAVSAAVRSAYD